MNRKVIALTEIEKQALRREEKAKQNTEHGANNGATAEPSPKHP